MAGCFTWKRCILAAVLVAGLPCVAPYNYNTCSGGSVAQTCTVQYSSHCCSSGRSLSAICCQNSCSEPGSFGRSSTKTCYFRSDSMCCSTKPLGSESCCNYADYTRTSASNVRGDYIKSTYGTCSWGPYTTDHEYCLNSLSTACCSSGYYASATCCMPSTCRAALYINSLTLPYAAICQGTSTYCCSSSNAQSCCNSDAYQSQESGGTVVGATVGGVFGGIILLLIIIVVPVSVGCCRASGTRRTGNPNTTAVAVTATSNQIQQPAAYQPSPYGYSQPPPYGNQPPAYNNQQWNQSSAPQYLPQAPPGPSPVEQPLPQQ